MNEEKCDHTIGYSDTGLETILVFDSERDDFVDNDDVDFEPFNYCPHCGIELDDREEESAA